MSQHLECPRCRQPATGTARRRGRCTACGAGLVAAGTATAAKEADVRRYLYGRHSLTPLEAPEPGRSVPR